MIIIGIDPGSRITGFGVVESNYGVLKHLHHGVFKLSAKEDIPYRLHELGTQLRELYSHFQPHSVVIEKIFLGKNADSAFKLGHARGVCMYEASLSGAQVFEYSTREVKKGVTGTGGAEKEQVALMMQKLLQIPQIEKIDASDALAMAYYHASRLEIAKKLSRMIEA